MTTSEDIIATHEIVTVREQHANVEEFLRSVLDHEGRESISDAVGWADIDFRSLRIARSRMHLLSPDAIERVASPEAAVAYRGFHEAFGGMEKVYGLACGPDRTGEQADALGETLRGIAGTALSRLSTYHDGVAGLASPGMDAYLEALTRRSSERAPAPPPEARSPAPRIRQPLDGEEAASRAREILGYAFGGLAASYLMMKSPSRTHKVMVAFSDLSEISARVSYASDALARRKSGPAAPFEAIVNKGAEDIQGLLDALEARVEEGGLKAEDTDGLADRMLACIRSAGTRVRNVERAAAERGYALATEWDVPPSPAP